MPDVEQLAGSILGEYRIERRLGQSQLGTAYLAQQPALGRRALVTTFNFPERMSDLEREQFSARFAREGAALVRLAHPHILPVYAFGAQPDYLFLVTAFVKEASLGQVLKQNTRFTPQQALFILQQLAAGLDYAHSQGITHGMLSLANVVVSNELHTRIAGFGLRTLLEVHGNTRNARPMEHLSSPLGVFLGSPEYISPERVLGLPINERADIYALGVILFTLLSGTQPFRGNNALEIALQRLQQPAPLVHAACPDVPEAFDLVLSTLLARDPEKRVQRAGDAVVAFERVVKALNAAQDTGAAASYATPDAPITLQPTVNWFDEQITPSGKWQVAPPVDAGQMPAALSSAALPDNPLSAAENNPDSLAGIDPFDWWSSTANGPQMSPTPGTFSRRSPAYLGAARGRARPQPGQQERRRLVKLIAIGTATAGALTISGISFANFLRSVKQAPSVSDSTMAIGNTASTGATKGTQKPSPTKPPAPRPTRGTQPPPGHTGKVIGQTNQARNSAISFVNPADGGGSLLIRLANGNFVACERACTHQGVPVNYDPARKLLICPAHGAIFDPQRNFAHISGPGNGPLTSIPTRVNGDGTVTTP